jgi:hypothetical protein
MPAREATGSWSRRRGAEGEVRALVRGTPFAAAAPRVLVLAGLLVAIASGGCAGASEPAPQVAKTATAVSSRLAMTKVQAIVYLRPAIRKIARRPGYRIRRICNRVNGATFNCAVSWWTSRRRTRGTYYTGDITIAHVGAKITYKFDGRSATARCIKRRGMPRCLRLDR